LSVPRSRFLQVFLETETIGQIIRSAGMRSPDAEICWVEVFFLPPTDWMRFFAVWYVVRVVSWKIFGDKVMRE